MQSSRTKCSAVLPIHYAQLQYVSRIPRRYPTEKPAIHHTWLASDVGLVRQFPAASATPPRSVPRRIAWNKHTSSRQRLKALRYETARLRRSTKCHAGLLVGSRNEPSLSENSEFHKQIIESTGYRHAPKKIRMLTSWGAPVVEFYLGQFEDSAAPR